MYARHSKSIHLGGGDEVVLSQALLREVLYYSKPTSVKVCGASSATSKTENSVKSVCSSLSLIRNKLFTSDLPRRGRLSWFPIFFGP